MRVQILPLPSVVVGDDVEEPFALLVDQHTAGSDDLSLWEQFKTDCGARAVLVTPETVEVVDRYAETPPSDDQAGDAATWEPNDVARAELRFHLGKGRAPGQPTARQVIASTLRGDWVFAEEPDHIERVTDAILAALDEQGLEITRRGDVASEVTALVTDGHGEISIYGCRHKILSWSTEFTEFWDSPAGSHVITLHTAPPDTPRTHPGGGE